MVLKSLKSKRKTVEGTKIKVGMTLVDKEGNYIGPVKEVHRKGFKVDRSKMHADDLFVPYSACVHDGPDQLKLEVKTTEAEQKDWPEADCA